MRRLLAICGAGLVCLVALGCYVLSWPSEEGILESFADKPYWVYPTYDVSKSPITVSAAIGARIENGDNVHLLLGSSELDLHNPNSSHPYHFFNEHNYALDTIPVGNAGFQSLFEAINVGALDKLDAIPDSKIALIVSMQWFPGEGCKPEAFQKSFSWESFELLASNQDVSKETLDAIEKRAAELGIPATNLRAAVGEGTLEEQLNYAIEWFFAESDRRSGLVQSLEQCLGASEVKEDGQRQEPDWDTLMRRSIEEAEADSSSNDWGIYDAYWEKYTGPWLESHDSAQRVDPYTDWDSPEFDDFKLFLQVCNEVDVEPLIILAPTKGRYYDMIEYPLESRCIYYDKMRSICEDYDVQYIDYSDHEYDSYFLRDVMHMGWTGWVYIDQLLMDFFAEDSQ